MDYRKYDRFFVLLEEQSEGFAMRQSSNVRGHIKIETGNNKGAMRIGVQNLKYQDKGEYIYKLIFFGTLREKTIYAIIGTVNVNRVGNGETYFRFEPVDMDKKGHHLSEFSHAIVAAVSTENEKEPLHPVLKGVLDIPFYSEKPKTVSAATVNGAAAAEQMAVEAEAVRGAGGEAAAGAEAEFSDSENSPQEQGQRCYNSYYNRYLCAQCYKLRRNQNAYDRVIPFKKDVTGAEWSKIEKPESLPIVSPGARHLAEKYRHYIFGKSDKFYYIGVPGRFLREEQPEEGLSGFLLWQPIIGAEALNATEPEADDEVRRTAYGYWIIAIDTESGDILEA